MGVDWNKEVPKEKKEVEKPIIKKKLTLSEQLAKCKIKNWAEDDHETILLFGPAKAGKTMAYMPMIKETINNGGKVYIINTDDGVIRTFKAFFTDPVEKKKMIDNIEFYYIGELDSMYCVIPDILDKVKTNDLIVVDLISEFWEMAQAKFIEDASGDDPINYIVNAQKDSKKFGLLEGTKWQYVKKIDAYIRKELVIRPRCNMIAVASEKDIEVEKAMSKKTIHKFDVTGAKPGGSKELMYDFNTLVYINMLPNQNRYFQIVGDRGTNINPMQKVEYGKDFYAKFKEIVKR